MWMLWPQATLPHVLLTTPWLLRRRNASRGGSQPAPSMAPAAGPPAGRHLLDIWSRGAAVANTAIGGGQQLASGASTLAGGAVGRLEGAAGTVVSKLHNVEDLTDAASQGDLSADQPQLLLLARQTAKPLKDSHVKAAASGISCLIGIMHRLRIIR